MVPSSGAMAVRRPAEPMAQGLPGSSGPAPSMLLGPLRSVVPMGWIGGTMSNPMSATARRRFTAVEAPSLRGNSSYQAPNRARGDRPTAEAAAPVRSASGTVATRRATRSSRPALRRTCTLHDAPQPRRRAEHAPLVAGTDAGRERLEDAGALLQLELHVVAGAGLDLDVVSPGGKAVACQASTTISWRPICVGEMTASSAVVAAIVHGRRAPAALAVPADVPPADPGPEQVVAVAEDVGRDGHPLPTIALVGNLREGVAGLTESTVMRPSTYPA